MVRGLMILTEDEQMKIVELYKNGQSLREIANKYDCSVQAVLNTLKRHNINRRTNRKYNLDENFFDEIDTPSKAYILGLFYADGYNNNKELCLKLIEQDAELLKNIQCEFKSDRPLRLIASKNLKHNNCIILELSSVKLCKQASKVGIEKNKTFKVKFPDFLTDCLIPHFIRGYFDGDGCIYYNKRTNNIKFTLLGTVDLCKNIHNYFKDTLGIHSSIVTNKRISENIKILSVGGNAQVKKVMELLYNNDKAIRMERKFTKYKNSLLLLTENNKLENSIGTRFKPGHPYQKH